MTNPIKLTIGGLLGGGVAIGGATYYLLNQNKETNTTPSKEKKIETKTKKAISEWLDSDNKVLLGEGEWANKWGAFKSSHPKGGKAPKAVWGFTDWDTLLDGDETKFKEKCTKLAQEEKDTKEDELYKEIKEHCTKEKAQTPS